MTSHRITLDNAGNAIFAFTVSTILNSPDGAWVKRYRNGVWKQFNTITNKYRILASEYTEGSGWSVGHAIDGDLALGAYDNPRLAIAANGDTTAVWEASTTGGTRTDAYASRFAGGAWSAPAIVTSISIGRADGIALDKPQSLWSSSFK